MNKKVAQIVSPDGEVLGDVYKTIEDAQQGDKPVYLPGRSFRVFSSAEKRLKMRQAKLSGTQREILDFLLSKTENNTGRVNFSPTAIAKEFGCSRNTINLFRQKMLRNEFFLEVDGNIHINSEFFWVGNNEECVKNRHFLKLVSKDGKRVS